MICNTCRHCGLCEGDGSFAADRQVSVAQEGIFPKSVLTEPDAFDRSRSFCLPTLANKSAGINDIGIAVDIGTTTVAASAWRLCDAKRIALCGEENLQSAFGKDVIARVAFASSPEGYETLHKTIIIQINHLVQKILIQHPETALKKIVIAGNTAMESFSAGVPISGLASFPFTAASRFGYSVTADQLFNTKSVIDASTEIYFAPVISAFVGGDIVCALTACSFGEPQLQKPLLLADIGTNCEMALFDPDTNMLRCTSAAAGPAFEGQTISCGMTASEGAVASVRVENDRVTYRTVGGGEPKGICGTGLVSACAAFYKAGYIDESGAMRNGSERIVVAEKKDLSVALTQKDIRNFQLAKAAVQSGLETLLSQTDDASLTAESAPAVLFLAGGFGTTIDTEDARTVGIIPPSFTGTVVGAGNASLSGATLVMLSERFREQAMQISTKAQSIDLALDTSFQERYIAALNFPPLKRT